MWLSHAHGCSVLRVPPPTPPHTRAVSINGPALRALRQVLNLEVADITAALHCNPSTISKLETGARQRCSPLMLAELCRVLGLADRRALLACPYGEEAHEQQAPAHDALADTAEIERPEVGGEVPAVVAAPGPQVSAARTVPAPRGATRQGPKHRAGAGR